MAGGFRGLLLAVFGGWLDIMGFQSAVHSTKCFNQGLPMQWVSSENRMTSCDAGGCMYPLKYTA